jgi:hypothetical protein
LHPEFVTDGGEFKFSGTGFCAEHDEHGRCMLPFHVSLNMRDVMRFGWRANYLESRGVRRFQIAQHDGCAYAIIGQRAWEGFFFEAPPLEALSQPRQSLEQLGGGEIDKHYVDREQEREHGSTAHIVPLILRPPGQPDGVPSSQVFAIVSRAFHPQTCVLSLNALYGDGLFVHHRPSRATGFLWLRRKRDWAFHGGLGLAPWLPQTPPDDRSPRFTIYNGD